MVEGGGVEQRGCKAIKVSFPFGNGVGGRGVTGVRGGALNYVRIRGVKIGLVGTVNITYLTIFSIVLRFLLLTLPEFSSYFWNVLYNMSRVLLGQGSIR